MELCKKPPAIRYFLHLYSSHYCVVWVKVRINQCQEAVVAPVHQEELLLVTSEAQLMQM